jgi:glycosyltransferase involved in cell wall biosynthesis/Na+-transporting methylmalonyl-CoA/oxaloacetate decarboxylase gamma subunit
MADPQTPTVSVVLPVYNEVGHLESEVERVRAGLDTSEFDYEIIVVDDGSTDGSAELARSLDGVRVAQFDQNRGSGAVRRVGTQLSRGDVVVWTDVDMTYPNDRIAELVRSMGHHDQVVGARTSEQGTHRLLRTPAKWVIRQLAMRLAQRDIPDLNSGFRAMRRDVAEQFLHLLPDGFSCVTTITLSFITNGYSVGYVPIDYAPRAGESKFHWRTDTRKYLLQVVRMIMMYEPLRILGGPGLLLLLAGLGKAVYDAVTDPIVIAINTLVLLVLAMLILLVGLLSDLVVRLNRPRHLVLPAAATTIDPEDATLAPATSAARGRARDHAPR